MNRPSKSDRRNASLAHGFTLVELLVVIAIISVLVATTLPALQASRETGRANLCQSHMAHIMLALQNYENAFEAFPPGVVNPDGPIRSEPVGLHHGWMIQLLPYIDEQVAYRLVDPTKSVYDPANAQVRKYWPDTFRCPSEPSDIQGASNYAGCHHDVEASIADDNRGVLFLNSHVRREDVSDGVSHTLFVAEKVVDPDDLGWMSGTRATLRNTGSRLTHPFVGPTGPTAPLAPTVVGGFGGPHPSGAFAGFGDASVRFISATIDAQVWQLFGNRSDGQLINYDFSE